MSGGNLYEDCPGTGKPVAKVTSAGSTPRPFSPGYDGTGTCAHCGKVTSQRAGVAKRHKAAGQTDDARDTLDGRQPPSGAGSRDGATVAGHG